MKTYTVEILGGSPNIIAKEGRHSSLHSIVFSQDNPHAERDAEIMADALNKFQERASQPITPEDATIAKQKN
jgi:hypothetical protein